jgi:hypothetical protein
MISGLQTARAFLTWDRRDLARKSVVSLSTIERLEMGGKISGAAMASAVSAAQTTLQAEGIEFTDDDGVLGVRLHPKGKKAKRTR